MRTHAEASSNQASLQVRLRYRIERSLISCSDGAQQRAIGRDAEPGIGVGQDSHRGGQIHVRGLGFSFETFLLASLPLVAAPPCPER